MVGSQTDLVGSVDHGLDELGVYFFIVARYDRDARAERLHRTQFFVAEGVRKHDLQSVTLGGTHKSQRDAGGARGVFHHRTAPFQASTGLSALDRRFGHAVFHAARRIRPFEFGDNTRRTGWHDFLKRDHGGVANRV